jgi:hypothetical protein
MRMLLRGTWVHDQTLIDRLKCCCISPSVALVQYQLCDYNMSFEDPEKRESLDHDDAVSRPASGRRKSSMSRRKNSAYEDPFSRKESVDEGEIKDAEIDYQSMEWW